MCWVFLAFASGSKAGTFAAGDSKAELTLGVSIWALIVSFSHGPPPGHGKMRGNRDITSLAQHFPSGQEFKFVHVRRMGFNLHRGLARPRKNPLQAPRFKRRQQKQ